MAIESLSHALKIIYDYEINQGNVVERVDEPAGTLCPLAIVFKKRLYFIGSNEEKQLVKSIAFWMCSDPHYPMQSGYRDETSAHVICGPLN